MSQLDFSKAMLSDRHWLRQQQKRLKRLQSQSKDTDQLEQRLTERYEKSSTRYELRKSRAPQPTFDHDLPINQHRDEIIGALREHQVIVVAGETGSGKSTQLPKLCLEAGFGVGGMIGHTQPRRIAARSVAQRIASELKSPLGEAVGYKVRFDDKTKHDATFIKLMTDGILLAEAAGNRFLDDYEVIILDEAHERSLNVDFLLGMLHELLKRRPELRLIVTSATIDAERFGEHFGTVDGPAPVIQVEGRTYPVEVRYRPLEQEGQERTLYQGIIDAVHELSDEGDMLVFLPTERDIREATKRLKADKLVQRQQREILPLYARLSAGEQNKIFHPGKARRVVLATNVAESSLTVPRIHCVIDSGTARISRRGFACSVCRSRRFRRRRPINEKVDVVDWDREFVFVYSTKLTISNARHLRRLKFGVPTWHPLSFRPKR